MDICDKRIEGLEKKFNDFEEKNRQEQIEFKELRSQFLQLKEEFEQLTRIVLEDKKEIDSLYERLNEAIKNYKEGDEMLKKKMDLLKKYIDEKLLELNTKLDVLLNNINDNIDNNDKKVDLSALDNFMQRLINLEKKVDEFILKANIDEIYSQLKYLNERKADKFDLEQTKIALNDLNKKSQEHQEQIKSILYRLDSLYQQLLNIDNEPRKIIKETIKEKGNESGNEKDKKEEEKIFKHSFDINDLDLSQYTLKTDFDSYVNDNNKEINKIWDEIQKIKKRIEELSDLIKNKDDTDDLNEMRDFLLNKIDELINDFNKRFADKNEIMKTLKYLEDQIKKLYSLLKSSKKEINNFHEADNWLLAKKPINGFSCAACESYIGDLRIDKNKFIAWNKLPARDPGDKLYRMGNGFSKMLNMLNFDNYGNVSLNPDSTDSKESENEDESLDKVQSINLNLNKNDLKQKKIKNNSKTLLKNRNQSASTLIKDNKENNKDNKNNNENKDNNLKLSHRTQNHFFKKEEIKNKYLPKIKKEMSADVIDRFNNKKEEKPTITKILKKGQKKFHIKESI